MDHLDLSALEAGLPHIGASPADDGTLDLIVRRPHVDGREVLEVGELDVEVGLVGDTWAVRPSSRMPDGTAHPDMQLNVMNSRVVELLAQDPDGWALAGDQLYVDLDLSMGNLPPGTLLRVGSATLEVSVVPHRGCVQFSARFGPDALRFASTPTGQEERLRGVNARIVASGIVRTGDLVSKI